MNRFLPFVATLFLIGIVSALPKGADETAQLIELDRQFQAASKLQDPVAAGKFLADDYELTGSSGKLYTKQQFLATFDPAHPMEVNESHDVRVRIHGDVAIVTAILEQVYMDNGERKNNPVRFTDTYYKTDKGWLQIAGHASSYHGN